MGKRENGGGEKLIESSKAGYEGVYRSPWERYPGPELGAQGWKAQIPTKTGVEKMRKQVNIISHQTEPWGLW